MAPRLILNADDFGLTPGINRAIAELHAAGCLTSATLMATGPAFNDAVAIAHAHPSLGVGCHIVLTDGTPVSDPQTLPTLCPNGRSFRPNLSDFALDVLLGRIDRDEIQTEAAAQIRRLQQAGINPTHLDTHKHTHIFSAVAGALRSAAQRTRVRALRSPFEPDNMPSRVPLKRRLQLAALHLLQPSYRRAAADILTTDGTLGIAATGTLNAHSLRQILEELPPTGTYELLCHPGYNDPDLDRIPTRLRHHRDIERVALLTEIPKILSIPAPPTLISYADL